MYDQNQADIMKYARGVIKAGFPPGVLIIDDSWQRDYGDWRFRPDRFPDPRGMVDSLHELGFQVMLWVCPFVSPDGAVFRQLFEREDAFLKDPNYPDRPKLVDWWNGYSALLDLTDPDAEAWFRKTLNDLQQDYGIDGFKFDGGDLAHYDFVVSEQKNTSAARHSQLYSQLGLDYPLNEYRATFGTGGKALAQRLRDKAFSWEALRQIVPGMTLMGIMGYPFACPDMVGGGEYRSFLSLDVIDQELIVRSAQLQALMPMIQFSLAPWRVLDEAHLSACREAVMLRTKFGPTILELASKTATSGEPIVRSMGYAFPNYGYDLIDNQFMLGEDILVAPVMVKEQRSRAVQLPPGRWRYLPDGKTYQGEQLIEVAAPISVLPYFERIK
jgi:alpha-glucosidase